MKSLMLGTIFYLSIASAFGAGYYEGRVGDCDPVAMQRAMDAATLRTGAGITVIKCDAGVVNQQVAAAPAPSVVYVEQPVVVEYPPVEYVEFVDYVEDDCDCLY